MCRLGARSTEELSERWKEAKARLREVTGDLEELKVVIAEFNFELKTRRIECVCSAFAGGCLGGVASHWCMCMCLHTFVLRFDGFCQTLKSRTNSLFALYMSERKSVGCIELDYQNHRLELQVTPEKQRTTGLDNTDTKTLSGGERSFTTVAFVMSLGDNMNAPFRATDEFDIFMVCELLPDSSLLFALPCLGFLFAWLAID
jgi:hypothetical protein